MPALDTAPRRRVPPDGSHRFVPALLRCVAASGGVEPCTSDYAGESLGEALLGGSLRLSFLDGTVQDHGLVASPATTATLARMVFGLSGAAALPEESLLDVLGETLNQAVGHLKEDMLAAGEPEPIMGTPSLLREQALTLTASHSWHEHAIVTAAGWDGKLLVVSSPREPLPLRIVSECEAALERLSGPSSLVRVQSLLVDLREAVIAMPKALRSALDTCDQLIVESLQTACDLDSAVAQVRARTAAIRPLVAGAVNVAQHGFELPDDEEDAELLWEYLEDGNKQVDSARAALDQAERDEGFDPLPAVFRALHTLKGNAGFFGLHQLQRLANTTEDLVSQVQSGTLCHTPCTTGLCRQSLSLVATYHGMLEEVLESGGSIPHQESITRMVLHLQQITHGDKPPRLLATEEAANDAPGSSEWFKLALPDLEALERLEEDFRRLLEAHPEPDPNLSRLRESLGIVLARVRQVPLDRLLSKVARLCRETADKLQKVVRVESHADHVTVPKPIFAALSGPLVHLARNAVDHGVESANERASAGKPRMGTIECNASWVRGWLTVEIRDDGRGLSVQRIRDKAIRLGLLEPDAELDDEAVFQFLTAPGFSTAAIVSDISGRGVGLDVVKSEVVGVGGRLEIESELGKGTCFRLVIPERPDMVVEEILAEPEADDEFDLESAGELNFL